MSKRRLGVVHDWSIGIGITRPSWLFLKTRNCAGCSARIVGTCSVRILRFSKFHQEGVQTNTTAIFGSAACAVTAYSLARQALIAHRGVFEMLVLLSTLWPELLTSYDSQKAIYHVWQRHLQRARFLEIYGVHNEIV